MISFYLLEPAIVLIGHRQGKIQFRFQQTQPFRHRSNAIDISAKKRQYLWFSLQISR